MGERLVCNQKVTGSNPVASTKLSSLKIGRVKALRQVALWAKVSELKPEIGTCIVPICVSVKLVWLSY